MVETLQEKQARLLAELEETQKQINSETGRAMDIMSVSLTGILDEFVPFFKPGFDWRRGWGQYPEFNKLYDYLKGKVPGTKFFFEENGPEDIMRISYNMNKAASLKMWPDKSPEQKRAKDIFKLLNAMCYVADDMLSQNNGTAGRVSEAMSRVTGCLGMFPDNADKIKLLNIAIVFGERMGKDVMDKREERYGIGGFMKSPRDIIEESKAKIAKLESGMQGGKDFGAAAIKLKAKKQKPVSIEMAVKLTGERS